MKEKTEGATQFMPFAALTGFYALVRERERIIEPRRERTEEENISLSEKIMCIKKGTFVKIKYYLTDAYEVIEGKVSQIDTVFRIITVANAKIDFDDIYEIEIK